MHVLLLGGSKNIGYFAALRLLKQGATITFLLRSTSVFDNDEQVQQYIKEGKVQLVRGDALKAEDVRNAWQVALEAGKGPVDVVLFTIGGTPNFSFSKGFVINPPDLCTHSLLNTLSTIPEALRSPDAQPRFVIITSMGLTAASHAALPLALKPLYGVMLTSPHADKLGAERVLARCTGTPWDEEKAGKVEKEVLGDGWENTPGLLREGQLKHVVIVRPALLTDGACRGDEAEEEEEGSKKKKVKSYRALKDGDFGDGYRVSRKDTAHFIVKQLLPNWEQWEGSAVTLAY